MPSPEARLHAYRAAYAAAPVAAALDGGIRAGDAHVAAHDPLRAALTHPAHPGLGADLALGVDPGTYFCGGLARALAIAPPCDRAGFVHTPPDAALPRPALLDLMGEAVATILAALGRERPVGRVLVTGFGPFPGVADNPTAAFAGDPARVAAAGGHAGVVLWLHDAEGAMHADMGPVRAQLDAAVAAHAPDVVVALGVDGRQALARPRFTVETQSRGMGDPAAPWAALDAFALALLRCRAD